MAVVLVSLLTTACTTPAEEETAGSTTSQPSTALPSTASAEESEQLDLEVLVEGLEGPTQISPHPDGGFLLAELGPGGEGEPTGRISRINLDGPDDREVLVDGINTPTGVTAAGDLLWIMEPDRLLVAPLDGGEPEVVFADMPNNGRSNGTITTLADGTIVFDTAGRRSGNEPAEHSGILWALSPDDRDRLGWAHDSFPQNPSPVPDGEIPEDPGQPTEEGPYGRILLDGMKHAYAVAEFPDGRLAVTEMSDGTYDGEGAPDEVLVITPDPQGILRGGWPRCIGNRQPVQEYDGSAEQCEATVPSRAVFDVAATPTGVAIAPWDPELLLVTNWTLGIIQGVDLDPIPPVDAEPLLEGLNQPQHLLADGDRVLVTVHGDGQIAAITRP